MDLAHFGPIQSFPDVPYSLYNPTWANLATPECTMIPPVAEFGLNMNELIFAQVY